MAQTVGEIICTVSAQWNSRELTRGDRVRIRKGYDGAGLVAFYDSKSQTHADMVVCEFPLGRDEVLAAAIEPYPYTKDERIERLLEDYDGVLWTLRDTDPLDNTQRAVMFALLDAGI